MWVGRHFWSAADAPQTADTDASFDDVRIYNRVLSDAEILALYQSESAPVLSIYKSVRIEIGSLVGARCQLTTSTDLKTWTPLGAPFTATNALISQYVDVADYNQYFKIELTP